MKADKPESLIIPKCSIRQGWFLHRYMPRRTNNTSWLAAAASNMHNPTTAPRQRQQDRRDLSNAFSCVLFSNPSNCAA